MGAALFLLTPSPFMSNHPTPDDEHAAFSPNGSPGAPKVESRNEKPTSAQTPPEEEGMDWAKEEEGWILNNLAFHLGQDPFEVLQELRAVGQERAEAETRLKDLEQSLPRVKAQAAQKVRSPEKTEAQIKEERRLSDEVQEHHQKISKARKRYKRLETEYWALKQEVEMIQSSMHLLSSELKTLRGA